jgi:4-hydroxythreonine-4-phosphate dehydrogenase
VPWGSNPKEESASIVTDRRPIAITLGDPAGIGPEITAKLFAAGLTAPAVVVGDLGAMSRALKLFAPQLHAQAFAFGAALPRDKAVVPVVAASDDCGDVPWGKIDARCGRAAHDAIVAAARAAMKGHVRAIVTAPIHKEALAAAGFKVPGHTELLAQEAGVDDVAMMLANDELRVLLVSIHIPLAEAIKRITTANVLRAITFADKAARALGFKKPRIAVAGLNPHAGENGLMGHEDMREIAPAIAQARAAGLDASGPWPPDTIFMRARKREFDIVVAQYHDQGLIPVKYLGLDEGVNVTIGLPFVRTSVDHGTAFDIAGQGKADPASLKKAFDLALAMTAHN